MADVKVKCPTCQKDVRWTSDNIYRPFCSERCRLIDLGEWASGNRYIPEDAEYDDATADEIERARNNKEGN
ncbi:MAG: DNA gyrase inhibitor YacG [Pseudomonadales bacterium]|nr:DNA gyrase inhibitor YacG [Pseudomonadales bacterium]